MVSIKTLWYNKSRVTSRICAACLRLYNVGDNLVSPIRGKGNNIQGTKDKVILLARQVREQELSGLCKLIFLKQRMAHY